LANGLAVESQVVFHFALIAAALTNYRCAFLAACCTAQGSFTASSSASKARKAQLTED